MTAIKRLAVLAVGLVAAAGCGETPVQRPSAVDVSGTLTMPDGKPADGLTLSLFVLSGDGVPANVPVTKGAWTAKLIPAKYCYFLSEDTKQGPMYKQVPEAFRTTSKDNAFDVKAAGDKFELKLKG